MMVTFMRWIGIWSMLELVHPVSKAAASRAGSKSPMALRPEHGSGHLIMAAESHRLLLTVWAADVSSGTARFFWLTIVVRHSCQSTKYDGTTFCGHAMAGLQMYVASFECREARTSRLQCSQAACKLHQATR